MNTIEKNQITDRLKTEEGIQMIKGVFSRSLEQQLNLIKVSAPIMVLPGMGINDDLNGIESPVSFPIRELGGQKVEIVQSLAKWKRIRLAELSIEPEKGIYTDMRAIRPDESLSPIHSVYVDQWDWEKRIMEEQRTLHNLKTTVKQIYEAIKATEKAVVQQFSEIHAILPEEITFIHAEELLLKYPDLNPKERENKITEKYRAVFIIGIGGDLSNGYPHDGRAPDYDDWSSETEMGYKGLNGDILLWNPLLKMAFEVSSMGIRVNKASLTRQLGILKCEQRKVLYYHKQLLNDLLPFSIGGGVGQSRLCMFMLRKRHVGEVQVGIWPESVRESCEEQGINLL